MTPRTILGLFAHPDDESMGPGGTLAKYAAAGHRVCVVTVTEGGAGRLFEERPKDDAERELLKRTRREETLAAARILGVEHLGFLGWDDGRLREHDVLELEEIFAGFVRRERVDVLITFHGSGISYHPDHRVVTLAAIGAFQGAGHADWYRSEALRGLPPHAPARLYAYSPFERTRSATDWPREIYLSPDAEITTEIDTKAESAVRWAAIEAHASQAYGPPFRDLYEAGLFELESFVRLFPGRRPDEPRETDLLDGL